MFADANRLHGERLRLAENLYIIWRSLHLSKGVMLRIMF